MDPAFSDMKVPIDWMHETLGRSFKLIAFAPKTQKSGGDSKRAADWVSSILIFATARELAGVVLLVNRRAILTGFGVKSASNIDHPLLITALPTVRSELGRCAWKQFARFEGDGWFMLGREPRSTQ